MVESLIASLPDIFRERARLLKQSENASKPEFVLYWMRTAVRTDENPALEVACQFAKQLDVPLLVYHSLSERYRFASDRHHAFILQGARDVQQQFARRGISYAFHLECESDRSPHLQKLANRSLLVVTEEMPVDPPRKFLRGLARTTSASIVCVDTACIVPMQLVGKAYTRAFEFRHATRKLLQTRINRAFPSDLGSVRNLDVQQLPFRSIDLTTASISELIASCEIDHSIPPVVDTVGGSTSGYARWEEFLNKRISGYARRRNDPLSDGVSRMSAYLHYGMVSPFRIARQAAAVTNAGSEKYLEELITWRELAYTFCFYRADHDALSAVPTWALETLTDHLQDSRPALFSWEKLARAQTGNELWDATQMSLLRQGELHNNVRMTWGKALMNWTGNPKQALRLLIDLNNRYALDGRDPASFGGILWCLGQFDRPFEPETRILGTVRPRPLDDHARRLDVALYSKRVSGSRFVVPKVAVIGAGIAGLTAARILSDHGVDCKLFEKSRGVGGRMSTRRSDQGYSFDHGAQYFTARDERFRRYVDSWLQQGVVAKWPNEQDGGVVVLEDGQVQSQSNSVDRFIAVPGMNSICKHLAVDLDVQLESRVSQVVRRDDKLVLLADDDQQLGAFDQVIAAIPAPQAAEMLRDFDDLTGQLQGVVIRPCWAVMVALPDRLPVKWCGAFVHKSPISWVARNGTKPGRPSSVETLVIHSTADWALEHIEVEAAEVADELLNRAWRELGIDPREVLYCQAHRWRYAIPSRPAVRRCLVNRESDIIACGDWAGGPRVEGAFLSGSAAAGRILCSLKAIPPQRTSQLSLFDN